MFEQEEKSETKNPTAKEFRMKKIGKLESDTTIEDEDRLENEDTPFPTIASLPRPTPVPRKAFLNLSLSKKLRSLAKGRRLLLGRLPFLTPT
jgi:hypothetical protein